MFAQHIGIKGKIVDSNRQALEGATVAVYRQDSVLVNGTISDAEGVFELKNLPAGNYRISVSYVGYASENIRIPNTAKNLDLGAISLTSDTELKEVTVTANSVIQKKDRLLIIPDKQQIKHAYTGYDLLYNLMIPAPRDGLYLQRRRYTVYKRKKSGLQGNTEPAAQRHRKNRILRYPHRRIPGRCGLHQLYR